MRSLYRNSMHNISAEYSTHIREYMEPSIIGFCDELDNSTFSKKKVRKLFTIYHIACLLYY